MRVGCPRLDCLALNGQPTLFLEFYLNRAPLGWAHRSNHPLPADCLRLSCTTCLLLAYWLLTAYQLLIYWLLSTYLLPTCVLMLS